MTIKVLHDTLSSGPISIGIDQSLTGFGLTLLNVDAPNDYRSLVFKSSYTGVQRLDDIESFLWQQWGVLADSTDCYFFDAAMEGTVLASHSALLLGELSAVVKLSFFDFFSPGTQVPESRVHSRMRTPLQVPPMTLKKYASGKGTSKKNEMLLKIYQRFGAEFDDDNAADSYALARLAAGHSVDAISASVVEQVLDAKYRDAMR